MPGQGNLFTALCLCVRGELGERTVPLPGFWRFAWHVPCAIDTLPIVTLVPNPRRVGPCRPFKWSLLKIWQFLPGTGTLGCAIWPGTGIARSQVYLPIVMSGCGFHCCHLSAPHQVSAPLCWSLPLLPFWMSVASLNPWLRGFHTA